MHITTRSLILSLGLAAGCQPAPSPNVEDSVGSAIIGGSADRGDPAVVALYAQTSQGGALCTASVIAPTVLLTAAHCVAPSEVGGGATFTVLPGADLHKSTEAQWSVKETHYDRAFDASRVSNGHDIAVVILDAPTTVTPLPVNRDTDVASLVGEPVKLVGYGVNNGATQTGAGVKRTVNAAIDRVNDQLILIGGDGRDTCQGDSGGPALATIAGTPTIVGITSFGRAGCGGGGYDTRVDAYASFLATYMGDGLGGGSDSSARSEEEPNDRSAQANDLVEGEVVGELSSEGDLDWFHFTVPGPSSYALTLTGPTDARFRVYKQSDSGALSIVGDADGGKLTRMSREGGIYYVKVYAEGDRGGRYTLSLK